jgi:hypothetical protein
MIRRPKRPAFFRLLVEVHASGVLVQASGHHVLAFFDGHAVHVSMRSPT